MKKPPISPKILKRLRPGLKTVVPRQAEPKRDNTFSQSRDLREDRGTRQIKTTHQSQTVPPEAP
jgi:hypothetical protein